MKGLKTGFVSSEFLGVVVSMLISSMVLFKIVPAEQAVVLQDQLLNFANAVLQVVTTLGALYITVQPLLKYIKSRTTLKQQAMVNNQAANGTTPPVVAQ